MSSNKYKKLLSDTGLFAISSFGSKILVFFLVPLYTNVLTAAQYGVVDTIITATNFLIPVLTLLVAESVLRFTLDPKVDNPHILTTATLLVGGSTLLLLLLKPVTTLLGGNWAALGEYWYWLVAVYFFTAVNHILGNYTRGLEKTKLFAASGILYTGVLICANILYLVVLKLGIRGYFLAMLTAEVVCIFQKILWGKYAKDILRFRFSRGVFTEMLRYSVPMVPSNIAWWFMQLSDKYVVINSHGMSASGIYSIAYKIPTILSAIVHVFTQAWQISAIKSYGDKDNEHFIKNVYSYVMMFSVGISSVLILLAKHAAYILYANEYFIAWTYVPILIVAYHFSGLSGILASVYSAVKKTGMLFISTSVGAVFNVVFNIILIPRYGVMCAAYTTMISFFLTWLIRSIHVQKFVKIRLPYGKIALSLAVLVAQAMVTSMALPFMYWVSLGAIAVQLVLYRKELAGITSAAMGLLRKDKKV